MRTLIPYEDYSREDVHAIFAAGTAFTPQSGTWGLHGIVSIPNRPSDFVFFVTFGQQQGEHVFDEGITEDGVLSWQSQPRQTLANPQIQQFITHDELQNSIYLFLRTKPRIDYTYLGRLKYLSHDVEREKPVYFQWQILNWKIPSAAMERMQLALQPARQEVSTALRAVKGKLEETPPPPLGPRPGLGTATFRTQKAADYSASDARNRQLGLAGELLVLGHEKQSLIESGRPDLAERVRHVAAIEGDGAGYDIQSFTFDGHEKYIEVKTTAGSAETAFFITSNEVTFARQQPKQYYLYRVYDYDAATNSGKLYVVAGNIEESFNLTPTQYRALRA